MKKKRSQILARQESMTQVRSNTQTVIMINLPLNHKMQLITTNWPRIWMNNYKVRVLIIPGNSSCNKWVTLIHMKHRNNKLMSLVKSCLLTRLMIMIAINHRIICDCFENM
jgi:hypothetical protein